MSSKSGELGRTQNPTGPSSSSMGSKSGELARAGSLKSASGDAGVPGSRSSSAARRKSGPGAPEDPRARGAEAGSSLAPGGQRQAPRQGPGRLWVVPAACRGGG